VATESSSATLVDTNVLLDVLTEDPKWFDWSAEALAQAADRGVLVINHVIYAEVSVQFSRIEDLDEALPPGDYVRATLPWHAAFLAGKCFVKYRKLGGERRSPLPDFFIGAHAAVERWRLLTRDASRYRTYFPTIDVIAPD
jgi:predicted nucleic acid-binding protein